MSPEDSKPTRVTGDSNRPAGGKTGRKRFRIIVLLLVNVCLLTVLELSLRAYGFAPPDKRPDPFWGFYGRYSVYGVENLGSLGTFARTNHNKLGKFHLEYFPVHKPPNSVRVFCLGGSAVHGGEFRETFAQVLKLMFARDNEVGNIEVINGGGMGYGTTRILRLVQEIISYQPDIIVVVTGHNEFLAQRFNRNLLRQNPVILKARLLLDNFRITHLIKKILGRSGSIDFQPEDSELPGGLVKKGEKDSILKLMEDNLRAIAALCEKNGIKLILGAPAANLKFEPLSLYGAAARKYFMAKDLLSQGRADEAYEAFWQALDNEDIPNRVSRDQLKVLARVARESKAEFVDLQKAVRTIAEDGVPGNSLFIDMVHANFEGNIPIALELKRKIKNLSNLKAAPEKSFSLSEITVKKQEELQALLKTKDTSVALAAAVALSKIKGDSNLKALREYFEAENSLTVKKLFLENVTEAEPYFVPFLLDFLENNYHFGFEAYQALLAITGQAFSCRSFKFKETAVAVKNWREWWQEEYSAQSRYGLIKKNKQFSQIVRRLLSDDLNIRVASISLLKSVSGQTLGYNPLALRRARSETARQWQEQWKSLVPQ